MSLSLTSPLIQSPHSFLLHGINWNDHCPHIPFYSLHAYKVSSLSPLTSYLNGHCPHGQQSCSFPSKFSTRDQGHFPPPIHLSSSVSLAPNRSMMEYFLWEHTVQKTMHFYVKLAISILPKSSPSTQCTQRLYDNLVQFPQHAMLLSAPKGA